MPSEFYRDPGAQGWFFWLAKAWEQALREGKPNPELWVTREMAHRYGERAEMDGEVVKKTGEVIPKESV